MENVADALKMAGAVLIFVLALSIAIVSFGQVRETADIILDYRDRETVYIDGSLYYETTGTERTVGIETIIPAIYRAYLENYKIVFDGLTQPIYTIKRTVGSGLPKYSLDLETNIGTDYENVTLGNDDKKAEFLRGILYGKFEISKDAFQKDFGVELPTTPLYDVLKDYLSSGKTITEYLGVYYENDSDDIPEVNKSEKRIITYKIQ
jgi:hypothetical protein